MERESGLLTVTVAIAVAVTVSIAVAIAVSITVTTTGLGFMMRGAVVGQHGRSGSADGNHDLGLGDDGVHLGFFAFGQRCEIACAGIKFVPGGNDLSGDTAIRGHV